MLRNRLGSLSALALALLILGCEGTPTGAPERESTPSPLVPASSIVSLDVSYASYESGLPLTDAADCNALGGEWNENKQRCTLTADLTEGVALGPGVELNCDGHQIAGTGSGIGIFADQADGSSVNGCTLLGWQVAFWLQSTDPFSLRNSSLRGSDVGAVILNGSNSSISNVEFVDEQPGMDVGVLAQNSMDMTVENSRFDMPGALAGVIVDGTVDGTRIEGNRFRGQEIPLQVAGDGTDVDIISNTFVGTGGLQFGTFEGQTLSELFVALNTIRDGLPNANPFREHGIVVDGVDDIFVGGNLIANMHGDGVFLNDVDGTGLWLNDIRDNAGTGVRLSSTELRFFFFNNVLRNGDFEMTSDVFVEVGVDGSELGIDIDGVGNYWGTCIDLPQIWLNVVDPFPLKQPLAKRARSFDELTAGEQAAVLLPEHLIGGDFAAFLFRSECD